MKKESRQHAIVAGNKISDSPATAGIIVRVPTNRSKFAGKSSGCRIHPVRKAKDKAKGTQKRSWSRDVVVSKYGLTTLRVANDQPGFKFSGLSATGILDHLADLAAEDYMDSDYDYDYGGGYDNDDVYDESGGLDHRFRSGFIVDFDFPSPSVEIETLDYGGVHGGSGDDVGYDDDDAMSYCVVGFVWKQVEGDDEGWCLVEEM